MKDFLRKTRHVLAVAGLVTLRIAVPVLGAWWLIGWLEGSY